MILDALHRLANHGQSLDRGQARAVMGEVLSGKCTDAQIAALLVALRLKGETVEEIVGFAEAIRAAATPAVRSIFPRQQLSSRQERACAWLSTAIAASAPNAARPMWWRLLA
jgi:hypothetical protein